MNHTAEAHADWHLVNGWTSCPLDCYAVEAYWQDVAEREAWEEAGWQTVAERDAWEAQAQAQAEAKAKASQG